MIQDNTTLTILSTRIRQDAQGRFCLNDCHRASGGSVNKRPGEWLRNEQTQSLVYELTDAGNPASPVSAIKGGSEQGTYVAKELVYAYAMWINPAFHLAVIRAFDAMVSSAVIKAPRPRRPSVLRTFNTAMKIGERIGLESGQLAFHAAQYCKAKCGENPLELMGVKSLAAPRDEHTLTPRQIGQELGDISAQRVNQELLKLGFQSFTIDGKGHRVYHLTELGKHYGRLEDMSRAHTQGGVTVLRWYPQIIDILGSQLRPVPQLERGAHQEAFNATV